MDAKAIRDFVNGHPDGIEVHMFDGTVYRLPGRDWLWMTPDFPGSGVKPSRTTTSFYIYDEAAEHLKLVNAMLVKELHPLKKNGKSKGGGRRSAK